MKSKRFRPSIWSKWLVPIMLALLVLGLAAIMALIAMSVLGIRMTH